MCTSGNLESCFVSTNNSEDDKDSVTKSAKGPVPDKSSASTSAADKLEKSSVELSTTHGSSDLRRCMYISPISKYTICHILTLSSIFLFLVASHGSSMCMFDYLCPVNPVRFKFTLVDVFVVQLAGLCFVSIFDVREQNLIVERTLKK